MSTTPPFEGGMGRRMRGLAARGTLAAGILVCLSAPLAWSAPGDKDFGALELIPTPGDWPYRAVCKVFSAYPSGGTIVGSGVLIGPRHVLTAGHLVYFNGEWADEIEVVPAYQDGDAPYGRGRKVQSYAWPGWVNNTDYAQNIGFIRLDRAVGAVTGYFDFGSNDDPGFYTGRTFNNAGYPSFAPEFGEKMYIWYGPFDSVDGTLLEINTKIAGGLGGGGIYDYTPANQTRTVYGVLSHSNATSMFAVRLTSGQVANIHDIMDETLASLVDLMPLALMGGGSEAAPGQSLAGLHFTCFNEAQASVSDLIPVKIYLSVDDIFDPGDTLLSSFQASISVGAGGSVPISVPAFNLPSVATGDYFLIVQLDIVDQNGANNYTGPDDVLPITLVSTAHTADQDANGIIDLSELLRVIQLFNSGAYHCDASGEDGFGPGAGNTACAPHAADYNTQDWVIALSELLRVIQFFNSGSYHPCAGGEDGFCPGAAP